MNLFAFLLQISLLMIVGFAQKKESKRLVLQSEMDLFQEVVKMKTDFAELQKNFTKMEENLTIQINQLKTENMKLSQGNGGGVYVRWGRNVCSASADIIYKGYTTGKHFQHQGSGTNYLCLPDAPVWSKYVDGVETGARGYIYGVEIETYDNQHIFDYPTHDEDIPCAVCQSKGSTTMMIPARNSCYGNWTIEYQGYLMSMNKDYYSTEYICVDQRPEFIPGGASNDNGALLYLVEGRCGSLPCPPYVDGRELACVVCSK